MIDQEARVLDPKVYDEVTDRVAKIIADLKIYGLNGHVEIDTSGRVPTASWCKKKDGDFVIKLGYELLTKLNAEETLGVMEHELLHHVHYRNCDIRNHLMSNIVLDVAINKILYLCNPSVTESWASKVYTEDVLEDMFADPSILVCPHLDADQIKRIAIPEIQSAYIDIWGSRETVHDFDTDVPVPLSLYYKLVTFIDEEQAGSSDSPFGEENENNEDSEQTDNQNGDSDQTTESDKKPSNKKGKNGKGKASKKRFTDEAAEADTAGDSSEEDKAEDSDDQNSNESSGGDSENKDETEEEASDGDKGDGTGDNKKKNEEESGDANQEGTDESQDGTNDGDDSAQQPKGYSETETDEFDDYFKAKIEQAGQAGKGKSKIRFAFAPPPEVDATELKLRLQERMFEQTIDEIGDIIAGSLHNNITRQPYVMRPTRSTLTYMACGVTDYLPVYYNETPGQGRPKVGCYVDVSGSMDKHQRLVHSIMAKIGEFMPSMSFVFSNDVMPLPTLAWNEVVPLGGGTSFDSVFEHICLDRDTKQNWLDEWVKNHPSRQTTKKQYYYRSSSSVESKIAKYIEEIGLQGDLVNEDFPTIFIITDGEDTINASLKARFRESGKKLVVLLLTEHTIIKHAFQNMDATVIQVNSCAEIISRNND